MLDGVHRWTAKYDDKGNQKEEAYFDLNYKPIVSTKGVHKWTAKGWVEAGMPKPIIMDCAALP